MLSTEHSTEYQKTYDHIIMANIHTLNAQHALIEQIQAELKTQLEKPSESRDWEEISRLSTLLNQLTSSLHYLSNSKL